LFTFGIVLRPSEPDSLSDIVPFHTGFRHIDTTKDAQNTVMVGISHLRFVFCFLLNTSNSMVWLAGLQVQFLRKGVMLMFLVIHPMGMSYSLFIILCPMICTGPSENIWDHHTK